MKVHQHAQGSLDWYRVRRGIPTASNFHKIITPTGKLSTQASKYAYRLVAERLLNETMDDFGQTRWMEHGKEEEPNAVAQFQLVNDVELAEVGFITTDDGRIGCSPDRLVRGHPAEAVEIKCPAPWTQIQYLLDGPGDDYRPQVQGQLLIGEFELVHFYSYHRRMPALHVETPVDLFFRQMLLTALDKFLDDLDRMTERARSLGAYTVMADQTPLDRAYPDAEADPLKIVIPE